jgi:hypothetical protein
MRQMCCNSTRRDPGRPAISYLGTTRALFHRFRRAVDWGEGSKACKRRCIFRRTKNGAVWATSYLKAPEPRLRLDTDKTAVQRNAKGYDFLDIYLNCK